MHIPEKQKQILEKTDEVLFVSGACHVFADEICKEFVAHHYQFCVVRAETWASHPYTDSYLLDEKKSVHVLACKDDYVIDVKGIKLRSECLVEWQNKNSNLPGGSMTYYKDVNIQLCSRDELFEVPLIEPMVGPMSRDRLYLHPQFLHETSSRARRVIALSRNKFDIESA